MTNRNHNINLSEEAQGIIKEYLHTSIILKEERTLSLIASLYARQDNANEDVKRILNHSLVNLEDTLSINQITTLLNEYSAVVRKCYEDIISSDIKTRRKSPRIPQQLVDFCKETIGIKTGDSVYLPNAGNCEFALSLPQCKCTGYESDEEEWAFSQIIMNAFDIDANIELSNTMFPLIEKKETGIYDCIVTVLWPYSFSMPSYEWMKWHEDSNTSLRLLLTEHLKDGGTMCIITSAQFTESSDFLEFRKVLVKESDKFSVAIISLPPMFLPSYSIGTQIWLIQKNAQNDGNLLLVNANDERCYTIHKIKQQIVLDSNFILESVGARDKRIVREIQYDVLESNKFTPERYFIDNYLPELKQNEFAISFGDLIEDIPALPRPAGVTSGKIVGMRELSDQYLTPELDAEHLPVGTITGLVPVSQDGLLVGFIGDRLKVGVLTNMEPGEIVYMRREIIRFRIRPYAPIKKEYLFRELLSEYVRKQAISLASGATIRRLSKEDLKSILIIVPPLEKQEEIVFSDGLAGMSAADREKVQYFEKLRKNMHMMKHGLGQTVFNLSNWVQILNVAREAGHGIINDNAEIGGLVKVKVSEVFNNIETAISLLSRQISTFDVGYGMKSTVSIPLVDFIDDYINKHPYPNVRYDFASEQYRATDDLPVVDVDEDNNNSIKATIRKDEFIFRK